MKRYLSNENIASLCMALSHLLHAGIAPADALFLLHRQEEDPFCKTLLGNLAEQVDGGASLADAVRSAEYFPGYVCTLLAVGQQVGKTEETLASLARYYTRRQQLHSQLRQAVLYPGMLLGVLLAVTVILLVWVLPVFDGVYTQLGSRLTGFAGGLLRFGKILGKALPWLCGALALIFVLVAIPAVRRGVTRWLGSRDRGISRQLHSARFMEALTMAAGSGMTDGEAVALAAALSRAQGAAFQRRCEGCLKDLGRGSSLAQALRGGDFLTASQCRLLDAGVRGGRREAVLETVSQELDELCQQRLDRAIGKVEPAMVITGCLLIGMVLLSVMLPLMNIMNAMG